MVNIYKSEAGKQAVEALYRKALERWPVASRHLMVRTRSSDSSETRARLTRLVRHLHLTYLDGEGHILPAQTQAVVEFLRLAVPDTDAEQPACAAEMVYHGPVSASTIVDRVYCQ
jgi:hypothetical protein